MPFFIGYAFGLLRAKGFFLFLRLGQETSPACPAGRGPFIQFPAKHFPMFHVELFLSSVLPLARSGPKVFSFPPARPKKPARPVWQGGGLLSNFLQSTLQCSTWNFFFGHVFGPLRAKGFFLFLRLGPRNQPDPSGGEVTFCPITPPNPSKCSTWNIFSPFKMPKSWVLCALLVSIPLQVCYNNRRSPFSG